MDGTLPLTAEAVNTFTPPQRDDRGRFVKGNTIARQGWQGLVQKRFAGDERLCKEWWGRMGAWHYDTVYRNAGRGHFSHPGTPEEFVSRYRAALEFDLGQLPELEI